MSHPRPASSRSDSLADLAARHGLGRREQEQLERLGRLLAEDPLAPSTIRDPARIRDDHLADSLVALELGEVAGARSVADLGAGAGLPGLCLAVGLPEATVWLVESNGRKCAFLQRAVQDVGLPNTVVVNQRAEQWRDGLGRCDLVTARALAGPDVVLEYAAPLLAVGGAVVAWRGRVDAEAQGRARAAAALLGLEDPCTIPVHPYPGAEHRHLLVARKIAPTPDQFPRRAGMAVKRPLGD